MRNTYPPFLLDHTFINTSHFCQMEKVKRRREHQGVDDNMAVGSDEKSLVKLNRQVIQAIQAYNRTEAQWTDWTDHVFELEDINRCKKCGHSVFRQTFPAGLFYLIALGYL